MTVLGTRAANPAEISMARLSERAASETDSVLGQQRQQRAVAHGGPVPGSPRSRPAACADPAREAFARRLVSLDAGAFFAHQQADSLELGTYHGRRPTWR